MPAIQRWNGDSGVTDANNAGGRTTNTSPNSTVFANDRRVSVDGSTGNSDSSCSGSNIHCASNRATDNGCPTVFINGIPVNFTGNLDNCSHSRVGGSSDVFLCAGGAGAIADSNPPMNPFGGITGGSVPSGPSNANTDQNAENFTEGDVHAQTLNDDTDDSGTATNPAPSNTKPRPVEEVDSDATAAPAASLPSGCTALPGSFNWNTYYGSPSPANFQDWARNPGTYPEADLGGGYNVADLSYDAAVSRYSFSTSTTQSGSGLTQSAIIQNLCLLVNNVIVPLSVHATPLITSGFRQQSTGTQHAKGEAVDLQFPALHGLSNTRTLYYNLAQTIRDDTNIKYDQLILEWYGRNPWIHISTSATTLRRNVLTQTSSNTYSAGLILIG